MFLLQQLRPVMAAHSHGFIWNNQLMRNTANGNSFLNQSDSILLPSYPVKGVLIGYSPSAQKHNSNQDTVRWSNKTTNSVNLSTLCSLRPVQALEVSTGVGNADTAGSVEVPFLRHNEHLSVCTDVTQRHCAA